MHPLLLTLLLPILAALVNASALTTQIGANERLCFFADVDKAGEKIGFYFAVPSFLKPALEICLLTLINLRFNPAALSTLTLKSKIQKTRSSLMVYESVRETMSSLLTTSANTLSASKTTCQP